MTGERCRLERIGPRRAEDRAPTLALALDRPAQPVAAALAHHGIMAGGSDFYAVRALAAEQKPLLEFYRHHLTAESYRDYAPAIAAHYRQRAQGPSRFE